MSRLTRPQNGTLLHGWWKGAFVFFSLLFVCCVACGWRAAFATGGVGIGNPLQQQALIEHLVYGSLLTGSLAFAAIVTLLCLRRREPLS